MDLNKFKKSFLLFFIIAFAIIKASGVILYLHANEENHPEQCVLCDAIIDISQTPALPVESPVFDSHSNDCNVRKEVPLAYQYSHSKQFTYNYLFSRPPPLETRPVSL